jgi:oligopeptide transport system substrate-binding protein
MRETRSVDLSAGAQTFDRPNGVFAGFSRFFTRLALSGVVILGLTGCDAVWNSPYPAAEATHNTLYRSFSQRPKHLDPARSYSSNEYAILAQIVEPPLQYHYLKRPYTLEPLTLTALPELTFLDAMGAELSAASGDGAVSEQIAFSRYTLRLREDVRYAPHPAFAQDENGFLYNDLDADTVTSLRSPLDLNVHGTRAVRAEDYAYQIRRLADPNLHSPVFSILEDYIVGLREAREKIRAQREALGEGAWLDLRSIELSGVEVLDASTLQITLKGRYPQFVYWLAMPFFAPLPWEADQFFAQPALQAANLSLDWYPVGSGAYQLLENNPNRRMVLTRNPEFHPEYYPSEGEAEDEAAGLLVDAGKRLPFIDRVEYRLEKEDIPYWNKFLQGYYDASGISSDSFDQAVQYSPEGDALVSDALGERGIRLQTAVSASLFYMGFNWLDPVVGGNDERARKLRQAISIAFDQEEQISIFSNGRGVPAQGPIPPGLFGHRSGEAGINALVYRWVDGKPQRRSLAEAKALLAEAGWPEGRDAASGQPLVLNLDVTGGGADDKARFDWYRKQFSRLGIQLIIRNTDYNRFQDKVRNGTAQLFLWGWNADYPDPENFLFLLRGSNAKVSSGGENASNYQSAAFDAEFEAMRLLPNGPERQAVIDRMVAQLREDAPWVWGMHPMSYGLYHAWFQNTKPNLMANNTLKYFRLDPALRAQKRAQWNPPQLQPLLWGLAVLLILLLPALLVRWAGERRARYTPWKAKRG